jgi:hypothetical protein
MTTTTCLSCSNGPSGKEGHQALVLQIEGPYPGHHIFRCGTCDERWIRHYGSAGERFGWTRFATQFPARIPRPIGTRLSGSTLAH